MQFVCLRSLFFNIFLHPSYREHLYIHIWMLLLLPLLLLLQRMMMVFVLFLSVHLFDKYQRLHDAICHHLLHFFSSLFLYSSYMRQLTVLKWLFDTYWLNELNANETKMDHNNMNCFVFFRFEILFALACHLNMRIFIKWAEREKNNNSKVASATV